MNILLFVLMVLTATILLYFVIGWLTLWFYYIVAVILVYITNDSKYVTSCDNVETIMWAWPILLPFALLVFVFYVPYQILLKFTPRSPA